MGPLIAAAAPAAPQLALVGAFGDIGPRVNGAAVTSLALTPKVGEFGPPIQVAASFGVDRFESVKPGGGVSTSLAAG